MVHYSKKSIQNSDRDFSDESEGEALIVKCYIGRSDDKPSGPRRFQSKLDSSVLKGCSTGRKSVGEKVKDFKCLKCGGADHFAMECKSKRVDTNKDYEVKYKKLLASLKWKNIDFKILVVEVENWVDDEE